MGQFDFKGQFPTTSLIDAALKRRQLQEEERQRRQAMTMQTIQDAGKAAEGVNKYQMNKQMAETLAQNHQVQSYMGGPDKQVGMAGGNPVMQRQTAAGGPGVVSPVPNTAIDPKRVMPFVNSGQGPALLKEAADYDYKRQNVTDNLPVVDGTGKVVSFQSVTRSRGGRTLAPSGPQAPRGGGSGKSPQDLRKEQLLKFRDQYRKERSESLPGTPDEAEANRRLAIVSTALNKEFGLEDDADDEQDTGGSAGGGYQTEHDVKAAMRSGAITKKQAQEILIKQFGFK